MLGVITVTATTDIATLSLHDALPISPGRPAPSAAGGRGAAGPPGGQYALVRDRDGTPSLTPGAVAQEGADRSEEHTSELQSLRHLVCRLLLEKKNNSLNTCRLQPCE